MSGRTSLLILALAVIVGSFATDAEARRQKNKWSRYQDAAMRDSLMSQFDASAVVVLDRDHVRLGPTGDGVETEVGRDWILFVRDPGDLGQHSRLVEESFPGHEIKKLEVTRIRPDAVEKLKVTKTSHECDGYDDYELWTADLDDLEAGDFVAMHLELKIEGVNPHYTHTFDRELPSLQSDIVIEVSSELMGGRQSPGFNWWAGSSHGSVPHEHWEKPTSWRFRWGEANIPALSDGQHPRVVQTTWLFEPMAIRRGLADTDGRATGESFGGGGPIVSAQELTGRFMSDRIQGERADQSTKPTQAAYGRLAWDSVAAQLMRQSFQEPLEDEKSVGREARSVTAGAHDARDKAKRIAAAVLGRQEQVRLPMAISLGMLMGPKETLGASCATALDQAVLIAAMLRAVDVDAGLVLLERDQLDVSFPTADAFDAVGVIVEGKDGFCVSTADGAVTDRLPAGTWGAALTIPVGGRTAPRLLLGDDLAALVQ